MLYVRNSFTSKYKSTNFQIPLKNFQNGNLGFVVLDEENPFLGFMRSKIQEHESDVTLRRPKIVDNYNSRQISNVKLLQLQLSVCFYKQN